MFEKLDDFLIRVVIAVLIILLGMVIAKLIKKFIIKLSKNVTDHGSLTFIGSCASISIKIIFIAIALAVLGLDMSVIVGSLSAVSLGISLALRDTMNDVAGGIQILFTKPFVIGALQRKIKAMFAMLEHHKPAKDIYDDGRLFLDFSEQTASLNGKALSLSPMEFKMLNLFRKNPRQVLTRGQLLEKLWDIDERFVDEHTLTTSISRIRSKIESDGGAPYIKTVYGMGYKWTGGEAK